MQENSKSEIPGPDLMCKAQVLRALHWKHYGINVSFHGDRARAGRNCFNPFLWTGERLKKFQNAYLKAAIDIRHLLEIEIQIEF